MVFIANGDVILPVLHKHHIVSCMPRGSLQDGISQIRVSIAADNPANADRHQEHSCDLTVRRHSQPQGGLLRRMVWSADNNPVGCII